MTPPRGLTIVCGASALAAFVSVAFLIPRGEFIAYEALWLAALCAVAGLGGFLYAREATSEEDAADLGLAPVVELFVLVSDDSADETLASLPSLRYPRLAVTAVYAAPGAVPAEAFESGASLVAFVQGGELPHPQFAERLVPYFSDPSVGFVQAAARYDGAGAGAEAYRAHAALGSAWAQGRAALGAAPLLGSGAMVAREALADVYVPGMSFEELGVRLQAMGFTARFESTPLVLAQAPCTMHDYWPMMLRRGARAFGTLYAALTLRGLPFAARAQYAAAAAAYGAAAMLALALAITPVAILLTSAGPLLLSHAAMPGLALLALSVALSGYALVRLTGARVLYPAAFAVASVWAAGYEYARAALMSERARRAGRAVAGTLRGVPSALVAIARGGGSAGSAPAGTPARS